MRPNIWSTVALVALSQLIVSFLVQFQLLYFYLSSRNLQLLTSLVFGQFEHILVSLLLALPLWWLARNRVLGVAYGFFTLFCGLYLIANQIFYQIFFDHFHLSYSEGKIRNTGALVDSFISEVGPGFIFNLMILAGLYGVIFWRLCRKHSRKLPPLLKRVKQRPRFYAVIAATLLISSAYFTYGTEKRDRLTHHPLIVLAKSAFADVEKMGVSATMVGDLRTLRYGQRFYQADEEQNLKNRLTEIAGRIRSRGNKPNILFVTVESVGAKQLLKDGKFDKITTPNLYRDADHMVIFPAIYSIFPGTARSHVPLSTGGRTITWGSVFTELSVPFEGPTLERAFKANGYKTAMFSATDLDYENLDDYYRNMPYDTVFEPATAGKKFRKRHEINSWGVDERAVVDKTLQWVDGANRSPDKAPFFIHFRTVSTHHPYSIPADVPKLVEGSDRLSRYTNALHFTDIAIGQLIEGLRKQDILDQTVIFIVGDHGQAFGQYHAENFTHKNFLYEENVRTFLLVLDYVGISRGLICERPGFLGDVMPTILAIAGIDYASVPGKDLFSNDYQEQINYFHKNTHPALWGLRDGQWKFISTIAGDFKAELYDLINDPDEQNNLASDFPERLEEYRNLCGNWYIRTNDEFVSHLKDFKYIGRKGMNLEDTRSYGPKRLAFGTKRNRERFNELTVIHPLENLVAWTHGVPYPEDKLLHYDWTSPSGVTRTIPFRLSKSWSTAWIGDKAKEAREKGTWTLTIRDGQKKVLSGSFIISDGVPLHQSILASKDAYGPQKMKFGVKPGRKSFIPLTTIHPLENMVAHTNGTAYPYEKKLEYNWISPSGKDRSFTFTFQKGWTNTWVDHDPVEPMEEGEWRLQILDNQRTILEGEFRVDQKARLYDKHENFR